MKKLAVFALCAAMVMSLAACGSSDDTAEDTAAAEEEVEEVEEAEEGEEAEEAEEGEEAEEAEEGEEAAATDTSDMDLTTLTNDEIRALCEEGMVTEIDCEPIELSLACSGTVEGTAMGYAVEYATEALSEWTNGAFTVTFYPSGQLGGDTELIEGVQMGTVDIFTGSPTSQVNLIPELAVLDIGGLYDNIDQCNEVMEEFKDVLEPYYNDAGLTLRDMFAPDFRILTSTDPVETADDLQGLNIRVQENSYHITFWNTLGCNATPMAFSELYIALQQGMMDAQENPWTSIVGAKLYEVQPYITLTNHIPFISTYVMNQSKYESMSDEQKLACDQFLDYCSLYTLYGTPGDDLALQQECEDYGCTVSEATDEVKDLFSTAADAVIEEMKGDIDPDLVDSYVDAAAAARD